jgi:hypothetical protein
VGCPVNNDYKRITVEVTNSTPAKVSLTAPVLVSSVVADQHALPVAGNPNANNPLDSTTVTCADASGHQVPCNNGLGNETANLFYLTDSPEQNGYTPPVANNSCMHYTDALVPLLNGALNCGGTAVSSCTSTTLSTCPQADLLSATPPPSSISQEYNFSPNLSASTAGRVLVRDPNATSCASTPSNNASNGEFWATTPLSTALNLSGNGSMTLYTNTLHGAPASVTICVGVYVETPVLGMLDPLGLLGTGDSVKLGVVSYTLAQWPGVPTPISFTFNYSSAAQLAAVGSSIGVRLWVTAGSADDIVCHYDSPNVASVVGINSA